MISGCALTLPVAALGDGRGGSRVRSSDTTESGVWSSTQAIQLQNVMGRADQRPFASHLLDPAQQELPEAAGLFDLPQHRFDYGFTSGIDRRPDLGEQLARHAVDARCGARQRATRTGPWTL